MSAISIDNKHQSAPTRFLWWVFAALLFLIGLAYTTHSAVQKQERLNIENNSSRNGKHANPNAQASAEQKYEHAKAAMQKLKTKANKTPEEKQAFQELEKQVKHWQKKKGWKGENHSQKHKGN
ncbi:MAG: hypothetical protein ACKVUS_08690 [Saprospiraceae bacterium]